LLSRPISINTLKRSAKASYCFDALSIGQRRKGSGIPVSAKKDMDVEDLHIVELSFRLRYSNDQPIPVYDVADALLALDGIVQGFLRTGLSRLTDTHIRRANVAIKAFQQGSFIEDLVLSFLFKDEASKTKFLARLRRGRPVSGVVGVLKEMAPMNQVVLGVVMAALVYKVFPVEADNGDASPVTINIVGANITGTEEWKFTQSIDRATRGKEQELRKYVARLVSPAMREEGAVIDLGHGEPSLLIKGDVVRAAVSAQKRFVKLDDAQEFTDEYRGGGYGADYGQLKTTVKFLHRSTDGLGLADPTVDMPKARVISQVVVKIYASDRDSSKRGWFGVIDGVVPTRTRILLASGVPPSRYVGAAELVADVTVLHESSRQTRAKAGIPTIIRIDKVHSEVR
jgi:hypothetical protein